MRSPLLPKEGKLVSIYFGGGTPSLLDSKHIKNILSWINPSDDVEITLEMNPESVSHFPGINRVSLGVQSFDNGELVTLTRSHTAQKSQETLQQIASRIGNVTIDLMYDLPGQTLSSWERSLDIACSLPIQHLSLYNLTIEPHTSFYKHKEEIAPRIPPDEMSLEMLEMGVEKFRTAGLNRYEISAFAKPGFESKHNTGYWQGRPFMGFGPSAFSYWEEARFRNVANLHKYAKQLNGGKSPVDFYEKLTPLESLKERLAVGLRMIKGVEAWPLDLRESYISLCDKGYLDPETLRLTPQGILFHDTVAEMIFSGPINY